MKEKKISSDRALQGHQKPHKKIDLSYFWIEEQGQWVCKQIPRIEISPPLCDLFMRCAGGMWHTGTRHFKPLPTLTEAHVAYNFLNLECEIKKCKSKFQAFFTIRSSLNFYWMGVRQTSKNILLTNTDLNGEFELSLFPVHSWSACPELDNSRIVKGFEGF